MLIAACLAWCALAGVGMGDEVRAGQAERPAASAPRPPTTRLSDKVLADLDADEFDVRHLATRRLLADETITIEALADAYARAQTLEQRQRLLDVFRHQYLRLAMIAVAVPKAAGGIGASLDSLTAEDTGALKTPVVRVSGVFPGFPSYAALEHGDMVTAVDGKPLADAQTSEEVFARFRQGVQGRGAGQRIAMTLVRGGKTIEVKVELVSILALTAMYDSATRTLREPFQGLMEKTEEQLRSHRPGNPPPVLDQTAFVRALTRAMTVTAALQPMDKMDGVVPPGDE
jgi:hypothetical protein